MYSMLGSESVTVRFGMLLYARHDLRNATESSAPEETSSAADLFDNVEGECAHAECLGDSVEARGEELGRCSCDAEGLEDSGSCKVLASARKRLGRDSTCHNM